MSAMHIPGGYAGKILRVNLTKEEISTVSPDVDTLRKYVGGTGLGIKLLYEEVAPSVKWSDPENRLIIATGPLNGTTVGGTGGFSAVTKGCLTNGATSVQAMGFLGAYLKFCGFDAVVLQGAAARLSYLYVDEGCAELRDATHLAGKDTWETERLLREELGKGEREISVFCIGPAGENLVKFACLVGDKGHVAAHNGIGAVMGSKKLKAIVVTRAKRTTTVSDRKGLSALAKDMFQRLTHRPGFYFHKWGTLGPNSRAVARLQLGTLPVKNYMTNISSEGIKFSEENVRAQPQFELRWHPCWACQFHHCHLIRITQGPFAGYVGEEPDYELWAGFGSLIGNSDLAGAVVLSNDADRLGMDGNESSWLIAWLMECCEKGLIAKEVMGGLEMRWGDIEAARIILDRIAHRNGIGDILAEGVKRAAEYIGGEAQELAVYTKKGNSPRMHDHRSVWPMMLDTCVSDTGSDEDAPLFTSPADVGLAPDADRFSPEVVAKVLVGVRGGMPFDDCLVICRYNKYGVDKQTLANLVRAATGWDFTADEVRQVGLRVVNLLRAFNIRSGHSRDLDAPSPRYGSTPLDGPHSGKAIIPVWDEILSGYYELMGWDKNSGKPLPDTLRSLGLEHIIKDIW
jgi:aldehyde:ferredoxin oxidoreductase